MVKRKAKNSRVICGLVWERVNWVHLPSVELRCGARVLRRVCVKYHTSEHAWRYASEWAAEHRMPFGAPNVVATGKTERAAVMNLLRLEKRILKALQKEQPQ